MPNLTTLLLADASVEKAWKLKDWDHMNPASRKAHGATGRARAAEKDSDLGDPAKLHAAAADAHRAAARATTGSQQEEHQKATAHHARRAAALNSDSDTGKRARKRITGPDHSLTGPRPDDNDSN